MDDSYYSEEYVNNLRAKLAEQELEIARLQKRGNELRLIVDGFVVKGQSNRLLREWIVENLNGN